MITDYDANIPVMRKGNRFGGENNWLARFLIVAGLCSLLIVIQSCTAQTPKLNYHYLPESYSTNSGVLNLGHSVSSANKALILNDDNGFNRRVIRFWKRGFFKRIMVKEHPYLDVNTSDIDSVRDGLNNLFDIYYLTGFIESDPGERLMISLNQDSEKCRPLSNHEIQFMMNRSSVNVFPSISLTMLVISSHELLMLKGAFPIYPRVLSPFLRERFQLPGLKGIPEANIFAEKFEGKLQPQKTGGFVYCRKKKAKIRNNS